MSKRQHSTHQYSKYMSHSTILEYNMPQRIHLDRQKGVKMCQKKLQKISNVKSKLCQTVLVKNTLKYVQNSENVTFACDDDSDLAEYEPLHKIQRKDYTNNDIDDI